MPASKRSFQLGKKTSQPQSSKAVANHILASLPEDEYLGLFPNLQPVHLKKGTIIYQVGDQIKDCYFPLNGMISILSTTENHKTVEITMIGNEGLIGIAAVLQMNSTPYQKIVQIESEAMRIRADALRNEFHKGGRLQKLLLSYIHSLICQISQSAVCNRFHTVEQRLCRWLLITSDRVQSNVFPLTQESISHMLGTPRTNVSMIANPIQNQGLIYYKRGIITIVDRDALEEISCECYEIVKKQINELYQ
jgi:CRP-like cAMP-binding protein